MSKNLICSKINIDLAFYSLPDSCITLKAINCKLELKKSQIKGLHLTCEVDFESYQSISRKKIFNLEPSLCILQAPFKFNSSSIIEIEIFLKPIYLEKLPQNFTSIEAIEFCLQKQSHEFQATISEIVKLEQPINQLRVLYLLLFTEYWLALSVQQHLPTGTIGYKTLWSYFYTLDTSIEEASQDQISESISNFIQDLAGIGIDAQSQKPTPESLKEAAALLRELASQTTDITSSESILSQALISDAIIFFFREEDWHFTKLENQTVLRTAFKGRHGTWDCYAQAIEREQQCVFYSICTIAIPEAQRMTVAEFITRANYDMIIGNFELDFDDGEVRYKTSIDAEGGTLTSEMVKQLVYANVLTMDRYLPGLVAIVEQNLDAKAAIALVESEP